MPLRRLAVVGAVAIAALAAIATTSGAASSKDYIRAVTPRRGTPTTHFVVTFTKPLLSVKKKRIEYRITLDGPGDCAADDYLVVWKQSDFARFGPSTKATITATAAKFPRGRFCAGKYTGTLARLQPNHDCQTDTDTGTSHTDCSDDPDEDESLELADFTFTVAR